MARKECLVSYVNQNQDLVCFRLTTENTIRSLEKVLDYIQYLKERNTLRPELLSPWRRSRPWWFISNLRVTPITRSQYRFIPSATTIQHRSIFAYKILRYGRSYWERYWIKHRMDNGI